MKNTLKMRLLTLSILFCIGISGLSAQTYTVSLETKNHPVTPSVGQLEYSPDKPGNATDKGYKLGSGNYYVAYLVGNTFSKATVRYYINSTNKTYTFGIEFSTDNGSTWKERKEYNNSGIKSPNDFVIPEADIPVGANAIKFIRTAGTSTYICGFTLEGASTTPKSSDASLSDIKVDGTTLPGFISTKYDYDYTVPSGQPTIPTIEVTTNDSKANAEITKPATPDGKATILVTAEDGTTLTYTINFIQTTEPTITAFTVAGVSATINQTQKTITATLPYGTSLQSLTPVITLANADNYTPTGAQDFTKPLTYNAIKGSSQTTYTVTLTVAPPRSSDATLKSISVDGKALTDFAPTTYSYTCEIESGTATLPKVTAVTNDSKAKAIITDAAALPGQATILVTAEDGTTLTYTLNFTVKLPESKLTLHEPETYEADTRAGGYGTPLVKFNNREYEVYYVAGVKNAAGDRTYSFTTTNMGTYNITDITNTKVTENYTIATDGWIEGTAQGMSGNGEIGTSSGRTPAQDEFAATPAEAKIYDNSTLELRIKGYDQFRIYAKDNNAEANKGKYIEVYVDGVPQPKQLNKTATIRTYALTTDEHVITIKGIGGSNNYLYAFSLRVSDNPRVKHIAGDDKTQTVNQTTAITPITYAIRNHITSALLWEGAEATGITLQPVNDKGDTLQVAGTANCPVGTYTYRIVGYDKNGAEASSLTGTFSVQTEVRPQTANQATVWLNDPMTPLVFDYDALNDEDITFAWTDTPAGLNAKRDNTQNTYTISGTPTAAGTYNFTLTAKGGNTLTGTIIVEVPAPLFIAPADSITKVKALTPLTPVVWTTKFAKNVTVEGLPLGISGTYTDGVFTISGTPIEKTAYPKTYTYTLTAEPLYTDKSPVSKQGQIIVIDPEAKSLLYLYDDNYKDGVYNYLNTKYDVTARTADEQMRTTDKYDPYDIIIISENANATNAEVLGIIQSLPKPVLNMEVFTYTTSRLNWGYPDNGSLNNKAVRIMQPEHPIFSGMNLQTGSELELFSQVADRAIMPTDINLTGSYCLATAIKRGDNYNDDGKQAVAIHEVPTTLRGGKYILLPLSQQSQQYLTQQGKRLIDNTITYLISKTDAIIQLPELRITSFSINGLQAVIDEAALTIRLTMPAETDLTALTPDVQLISNATVVTPDAGETIDFSDQHYGVNYTVSDFINKKVYQVIVSTPTGLQQTLIEGVWFDGTTLHNTQGTWLNIYDVMGRLLTTTNNHLDMSHLPHGVYLIQSPDTTMSILR